MNSDRAMPKIVVLAAVAALGGCASTEPKDYTVFRAEDPHSILVLPALNNTTSVEAAEFFISTVSKPFAERGYYVFPAFMVRRIMADDGLDDAGLVHSTDTRRLGQIFNCDSALYISINKWDSKYILISTTTTVSFDYALKSCRTGQELWRSHQEMQYSPSASSSGNPLADIIAQAVVSAIEKAAPNYIPLAQKANSIVALTSGQGLPAGPYLSRYYEKDYEDFPAVSGPGLKNVVEPLSGVKSPNNELAVTLE